jgi:hypothetical protein
MVPPPFTGRGTAEGGGGGGHSLNVRQYLLQVLIAKNIGGAYSEHSDAFGRKPAIPP